MNDDVAASVIQSKQNRTRSRRRKRNSSRGKRFVVRLCLMSVSLILASKGADILVGWIKDTRMRHDLEISPAGEYRHKTSEFEYIFTTNSLGLRGEEIKSTKDANTTRIAILGDSFVAGLGVEDDEVFSRLVETNLNELDHTKGDFDNFDVMNAGRTGFGTIRQYQIYDGIVRHHDPDVVVLAFFLGNDLTDVLNEESLQERRNWRPTSLARRAFYFWCPNIYLELSMLKRGSRSQDISEPTDTAAVAAGLKQSAIDRGIDPALVEQRFEAIPKAYRNSLSHRLYWACMDPSLLKSSMFPDSEEEAAAWPRVESHLGSLKRDVERDGAKLLIVALPDAALVDEQAFDYCRELGFEIDDDWLTTETTTGRLLREWCERNDVPYLDTTPAMRAQPGPLFYKADSHFNSEGHVVVANCITEFIQTILIGPSP